MKGPVIASQAVTRRFGAFTAVDSASIELLPGEIHAIVGENGAGKSTLLKVIAGALAPSSGQVLIDGQPLSPPTPAEAIRRGIGMVHQHFMLVGAFRALENVILGSEPLGSFGRLDMASARARAEALMESAKLTVPLDAVTDTLTVGERQRLEILRVLYRGARAVLLDEPTAVLSPLEAEELYATLRRLAKDGSTLVVVTHRLDEVERFADRVTVMRRGQVVLSSPRGEATGSEELTRAIMGGEPPKMVTPPELARDAEVVLDVRGLSLTDAAGQRRLAGVDLRVKAGEIVGVAGVEGNGQRELCRAIAGLEPRAAGRIAIAGRELSGESVRARRSALGVVLEDRHVDGVILDATVGDNLILGDLGDGDPRFDEQAVIARRIEQFQVNPQDPGRLAGELSGGNQQKIVIARALDRLPGREKRARAAVVLAQPTRGVDVGAAAVIHAAIVAAAARGLGVLLVSADLSELRRLCHRIVVMRRGAIVADLPSTAEETEIGRAMLGTLAA